jgi:integrase/recombinase XerD
LARDELKQKAHHRIVPKVPHKLPTVLSQDEVVRLIDAAPNRLYRMIMVLLYATGLRRTEAARIKVEDIDSQRTLSPGTTS